MCSPVSMRQADDVGGELLLLVEVLLARADHHHRVDEDVPAPSSSAK
jgi:hypothetical protein